MFKKFNFLFVTVLLLSCGKDIPTLKGIDSDKWKNDKNACRGERKTMEPALRTELSKLKGLSEMDIIKLLGRPDENELYKGNQKFYRYYITAAPACTSKDSASLKLILRFNAMGNAQLVSVE